MHNISINQLGYRPNDKKLVAISFKAETFKVMNEKNQLVFEGKFDGGLYDEATKDYVYYGDFTEVNTHGSYYIDIDSIKSSHFLISNQVYVPVHKGLLKAFYYQRCGCPLHEEHAGVWKHDICHTKNAILYENPSVKLDVTGGWHDAGDYGRYVVPAGKAVADLLYAYDFFPNAFKHSINIPESGNHLPEILNEAKYEIDWLFKMQDIKTGGVYHKVATKWFPGMIMPEVDKDTLFLYSISSPATGDFAATMALSARIFEKFDLDFSKKCLEAAELAWKWLMTNPTILFKNKPDIGSGEYGDRSDLDEIYWAAAELYRTTNNEEYHFYIKELLPKLTFTIRLGWGDVSGYGSIAYLFNDKNKVDINLYNELKNHFLTHAYNLLETINHNGYKVSLKPKEYFWGSNMVVLNNAMHLIIANFLQSNIDFIEAAIDQWNYILGLNSLQISFVTGFGSNYVMNPHHRPSHADGIFEPVPGLVSGGPCSGLRDEAAKKHLEGLPPAKCFIDVMESYSTNEITIYWNSPAVFVSAYLNNQ